VIDDGRLVVNEDSEAGMGIYVLCPGACGTTASSIIQGTFMDNLYKKTNVYMYIFNVMPTYLNIYIYTCI
jgi:hypothetical protein